MNTLPAALRERLRPAMLPSPRSSGAHVLYCLRTTYRAEHNPALEVALIMASALGLPLLCVAVIEDSTPRGRSFAPSDRSAAFRLEALRELQPLFKARGTELYVHVERDGCRQAVAMSLAAKAALVVFDEHYGVDPHAAASARIAQAAGGALWLCDTSCTVPSVTLSTAALSGGNAGFLRATAAARAERLANEHWFPPAAPAPLCSPPASPPAWSVDLSVDEALEAVLAAPSRRDTSVSRVRHTRGGPKAAATRWTAYVKGGGLRSYANHRNNPLAPDGKGASRMSAYINCGMIDPYLLARDAKAAGADKFLSEFVGFREVAHLWCLLHPGGYADASVAVPAWARGQLRAAASRASADGGAADMACPPLEAIEAGHTGDALWDDCQRCLVISGELHNNVRMAWGKAIPNWHFAALRGHGVNGSSAEGTCISAGALRTAGASPSAATRLQAALDLLIRLNDRFALDGGAPPSYGGLLWCLGWRDRPGSDGCPTPRPTSVMASRIKPGDLERRAQKRGGGAFASFISQSSLSSSSMLPAPDVALTASQPTVLVAAPAGTAGMTAVETTPRTGEAVPAREVEGGAEMAAEEGSGSSQLPPPSVPPAKRPRGSFSSGGRGGTSSMLLNWLNHESAAALPPGVRRASRDSDASSRN